MKQLKQLLLVMAIALTGFTPAQAQTTWTHYSEWMANTQKSYVYQKSSGNDYWRYDDGLMYESILDTYEHYKNGGSDIGDATLKNAVKSYIDNCVNSSGSITNYESTTLDDIRPARMVYKYFKLYGGENLKTACRTVLNCNAFKDDVRVISQSTGYPWQHKGDYAHQVWLDGIFMGLPYWTLAGPDTEITSTIHGSWTANDYFDDAVSQMQITDEKTYEPTNGLWCHAWDATSPISFFWATKTGGFLTNEFKSKHSPYELVAHNGRSSHCWGRALGWFAMAIMETMDNIAKVNGASDSRITTLKALFKKVMDKVVETRDPSEGVWHCVIDVDATQAPYKDYSTKNNYLEATCSAMFTYCLLHGVAQGYLDSSYLPIAKDAYNKFITKFIDGTGTNLIMSKCMSVGGLDNDKKGDTKRDGSYAYYMSESIVNNDSKGVGPFIWASLEAEKTYGYTIGNGFSTPVASNDLIQFRWSRVADDFTVPGTTPSSFVSPTFTAKTHGGSILDKATKITFSSDNTAVATVDANGNITLAGEAGTANIKATMKSGAGTYVGEAIYTVTTTGTDTTKPTLSSSTPATGATDVAVSGNIVLTFSENVTINDATKITLTGGAGTLDKEHATTDGATITIPYSGLANSTDYTLNIDAGAVKDLADNTNDELSDITFTTIAPDETAPTLKNQSIENNATNVSASGTIVLTFSEDVACTTNATLSPAGGAAINLTPSVSGSTVTYSYSGLSNETSYTFNLAANSVADLSDNKYTSAISFSFTTGAAPVNNTYSFGFNQAILDTYDSSGKLLSAPSYDGTVIDISSYGSSAALACGDAYVTSASNKEKCVSISNNASENYNQHYVEIHSTEDIKSIYLVAAVTGGTTASDAVAVGWTGTPSATISEYQTFTTPGKGDTSGKEISISFTTEGIKYVRLYRRIKLDSSTKTTFTSSSSTTIPSGGSTYGISFIKVTTQTGSTPTPSKVATPEITGTTPFSSSTSVTMSCTTTGATIHYTTDGSTPTASSTTYSSPIAISATTTIRAIAVKEGMTNSEVASKTFTQDNTPSTYTLTNTVNPEGYGTVSPTSVSNIPSGTTVTAGTGDNINKYTVGETTVTATPATATDEYTYTFTGWSNLPSTVKANTTVTANFTRTAKEYTLEWNSNGGSALSGDYTSGTVPFGTAITAPNNPTRDGYTFNGWKSAQNGSGTAPTGTMPAANTTYYAQWLLEGEETSETVTPTGIDSSNNLTFSTETNLVVNLPNGSMEHDEAKFKGDAAIDISSVGSKYIKEIVITYDDADKRHPDAANSLTIKNVTSNGSVVTSGSVLGSVTSTTSSPYTTTWTDNSGAKNINKVTLNYANNSHSLYISNIKVTYWGASETPTVEAPTFTAHPANATYTQGDTPTALSVTATGNPAPTYQWYKNTDNDKTAKVADQIEGATAATLPVANISTATAGTFYYYCVATNSEGTATSNSATITVNAPALAISTQPTGATYTQNASATALNVTATGGSTPYSYQWYSNDTNDTTTPTAVGTNSDSYTPLTTTVGTTYYYCVVTDNASTTVTSNIVAITVNTSGGGGGSGTVLFSQDFNSATEITYAASTARTITATSGNNIVGTDDPSTKFTSITCNAKNTTGIGINSKTGGNNKDYTGKFGAFYNNTEAYWSIVKSTKFVSTAPTAIKVVMNAAFSNYNGSGSDIGVQVAIGSGFTDGLTNSCPALTNCVAGFALPHNSSIKIAKYSTSNSNSALSGNNTLTAGTSYTYTWIINNTNESLTYTDPTGTANTVAANCWDLWVGNTRYCAGIPKATTGMSGKSLENIYIGSPFGKKHEFILDDIVVTDLSPAAMRTTTATIKAGKQYATFNTTMDIDFDETEGLQAFVVDNATKSSVHLREVTVVPANTALIIKGAPNTYTLYETKKATESVSDNQLIISNSTIAADNMYYALGTVNGVQGFHRVQNGLTIPTSYVIITDQTAKSFLNFEEEENIATGIDGFATDNGFIVIDDNTPLYNLSGQRVSKSYKGIVIINGKKVLRK